MMGWAFERLNSYEPALWAFCALMLLASTVALCLGLYRYPTEAMTQTGGRPVLDLPATERA